MRYLTAAVVALSLLAGCGKSKPERHPMLPAIETKDPTMLKALELVNEMLNTEPGGQAEQNLKDKMERECEKDPRLKFSIQSVLQIMMKQEMEKMVHEMEKQWKGI